VKVVAATREQFEEIAALLHLLDQCEPETDWEAYALAESGMDADKLAAATSAAEAGDWEPPRALGFRNLDSLPTPELRRIAEGDESDYDDALAEAAVLARHANAKVTAAIYAGVSEKAKAQIASKLVDAGFGS
jgi:hypothetical protein